MDVGHSIFLSKWGYKMLVNDLVASAYKTYADVQHIINIITDNDYISVTELSELLNKVLDTESISSRIINKLLLDKHFITKTKKISRKKKIRFKAF